MVEERLYWLGFSAFSGIGPGRMRQLLSAFKTAKSAWEAGDKELEEVLGKTIAERFLHFRLEFSIENYVKSLERKQIWYLTWDDYEYPKQLLDLPKPPFVLYGLGNREILSKKYQPKIAIVGTRKPTSYGREVTESFTREVVESGFLTVSGMALGIDYMVHNTTLDNKGYTVAVLGNGVDLCFPSGNKAVYRRIQNEGGAIISEYPPGTSPSKGSFPARNRIIAALSDAVLVTEGAEDSGSLITGEIGLKLKRPVFAIPGPITSNLSKGPYKLIKNGGILVNSAKDILNNMNIKNDQKKNGIKRPVGATPEEEKILSLLTNEPLYVSQLVELSKIPANMVNTMLSLLELKGMVRNIGGKISLIQ